MRRILPIFVIACAVCTLRAADTAAPAEKPAGTAAVAQLAIDLTDGAHVVGTPASDKFKVSSDYEDFDISLSLVRVMEFSGDGHALKIMMKNGDELNGRLHVKEIPLKTSFGDVNIPVSAIRRIRPVNAGGRDMPAGLVLYYTFDGKGEDHVADASGTGNDGTIQDCTVAGNGKSGGAMNFTGDHSAVIVKNAASLRLQDFTISAWVKRADKNALSRAGINGDAVIFGYGQGGYALVLHDKGSLALTNVGVDCVVAVTREQGKAVFYMDGRATGALDYDTGFEFTTGLAAGARGDDTGNSFAGMIDELMVFKRALSADEMKQLYEQKK